MKKETAERIVNYIGDDARVYDDYSGRGMYGRTTYAVVVEWESDMEAACKELDLLLEDRGDIPFRRDSLGLQIVYY